MRPTTGNSAGSVPGSPTGSPGGMQRLKTPAAPGNPVVRRSVSLSKAGSTLVLGRSQARNRPVKRATIDVPSNSLRVPTPLIRTSTIENEPKRSARGSIAAPGSRSSSTPPPLAPPAAPAPPVSPAPSSRVDLRAALFAKQYHLSPYEATRLVKAWQVIEEGEPGMEMQNFHCLMCKVFGVHSVNPDILLEAYAASGFSASGHADPTAEKFLDWYMINMMREVESQEDCSIGDTDFTYALARKHGCKVSHIDGAQRAFTRFDADGSGEIDYQEFTKTVQAMLKVADTKDLSDGRVRQFWQEVTKTSNNTIDLSGFCEFYLKYFNPENDSLSMGCVDAFYASYHPAVQRRNVLDALRE